MTLILLVHIAFIIVTVGCVLFVDEYALEWMRGKRQVLDQALVEKLHVVVGIGLAGLIMTGGIMFLYRAEYLLHETVFLIKMCFVLALVINGFFIEILSRVTTGRSFEELTKKERVPLLLSGVVSVVSWLGVVTCGLLL
jgi:uncharacterized membrane protein